MADSEPEVSKQSEVPKDLCKVPEQLRAHVFKPGQSGNPGGMPKDTPTTVSAVLRQAMKQGGVELAVRSAIEILARPNHKHWFAVFREIMDRTEGKVADKIHHEMKRFEEGIELRDGRAKSGPVPLPTVIDSPSVHPAGAPSVKEEGPAPAETETGPREEIVPPG